MLSARRGGEAEAQASVQTGVPRSGPARLRVLHFHSSVGLFGPERWTLLVTRHADPATMTSHVMTIGTRPGADELSRVVATQGIPGTHLPFSGRLDTAALRALRTLARRERIDVLHTHGFKTDVLGWLALRRSGVRLVTTTHGWCDHQGGVVRLYEVIGRRFLRGFDRVMTLTGDQRDVVLRHGVRPERIRLVPNAVDVPLFSGVFEERSQRRPGTRLRVVFIGRVVREKGVLDLVHALARLGGAARLVVVGQGESLGDVAALASRLGVRGAVELAGVQPDVRPFLARADLLALPSYSEGTPRVVMEAFAAGVPVVASDVPGVRVLVRDGETGVLFPAGRVEALAAALRRVREDQAGVRRMVTRAHELIVREHSPQRLLRTLVAEYRDVLANP